MVFWNKKDVEIRHRNYRLIYALVFFAFVSLAVAGFSYLSNTNLIGFVGEENAPAVEPGDAGTIGVRGNRRGESGGSGDYGDDLLPITDVNGQIYLTEANKLYLDIKGLFLSINGGYGLLLADVLKYSEMIDRIFRSFAFLLSQYPDDEEIIELFRQITLIKLQMDNVKREVLYNAAVENYEYGLSGDRQTDLIENVNKLANDIELDKLASDENCRCEQEEGCAPVVSHISDAFNSKGVVYGDLGIVKSVCSCSDGSAYAQQDTCVLDASSVGLQKTGPSTVVVTDKVFFSEGGGSSEESEIVAAKVVKNKNTFQVTFFQNGDDISLSPPDELDSCANFVLDEGEKFIDCGGNCRSCSPYGERKNPWAFWFLLVVMMSLFLFYNHIVNLRIRRRLFLGNSYLIKGNARKAVDNYYKIKKIFDNSNSGGKYLLKQDILLYYLKIKELLKKKGIKFSTSVFDGGIPSLKFFGNFGNTDIDRIKRLIHKKARNAKEAEMNLALAREIFGKLDIGDKRKIKRIYWNYIRR